MNSLKVDGVLCVGTIKGPKKSKDPCVHGTNKEITTKFIVYKCGNYDEVSVGRL